MFIIESKSCTGVVRIRDDGSGGDEWEFPTGRGSEGRGSPLSQARRQADYLRAFIQSNRESLLGTVPTGLKTLAKVLKGTDQRGVINMPMQAIVAISERGRLDRTTWKPRTTPFVDYVCKADQVVDKINIEFARHKKVMSLLGKSDGQYGIWIMKAEEVEAIATFLSEKHSPRTHGPKLESPVVSVRQTTSPAVTSASAGAGCKACASHSLVAMYGKYGYYWKCSDCGTNTAMPRVCTLCAEDGAKTKKVRIRKDGPKYYRTCESCSIEECIWTEKSG